MNVQSMRSMFAKPTHWLFQSGEVPPDELTDVSARRFWAKQCLGQADESIYITDHGKLVGFFRYLVLPHRNEEDSTWIIAQGTWVHPAYRGLGLATKMWGRALGSNPDIEYAYVVAGSRAGCALVRSLRAKFGDIIQPIAV